MVAPFAVGTDAARRTRSKVSAQVVPEPPASRHGQDVRFSTETMTSLPSRPGGPP